MDTKREQIQRLSRYEAIFDNIQATVRRLSGSLDDFEKLGPEIDALNTYYTSETWKTDFADDEAGHFPSTLKRGVISEDGIYNLLDDITQLQKRLAAQGVNQFNLPQIENCDRPYKTKEFKIIEFKKHAKSYVEIEHTLTEKSAEGWEIVNMTADVSADIKGTIAVLLQRDM